MSTKLIDKLERDRSLTREEWTELIRNRTPSTAGYLLERSQEIRIRHYGHDVYIRGLIEFTNYCKNDCYYCGIRKGNHNTDERLADIVASIRSGWPDCAITLSAGERSRESYRILREAGADRYLLRHETYDSRHYGMLHPPALSAEHRRKCLWDLKDLGYQVGTGFMVGSPFQTPENLADDMLFLTELNPQMVGIGPFIPHHDTPFADRKAGTPELTLFMLGLIRLLLPKALLPSTTALGSIIPNGREQGILAGANVVMPNLSPAQFREKYLLYDNKLCTGSEAAESLRDLKARMESIGYHVTVARGDSLNR